MNNHSNTAKLLLPSRVVGNAIFKELQQLLNDNPELPDIIDIDFSRLSFIRSPGVAFLSNFSHWIMDQGTTVTFSNLDINKDAIKYLDDSMFFKQHLRKKLNPSSKCRPTTIPLKQVARRECHAWLEFDFLPWLMGHSGLTKTSLAEVVTCLKELFNNIDDHTKHEHGCVFGQWHPKEKQIIISIADFGLGIPNTVRRIQPDLNDTDAILKAVEDRFSSMSLPTNRGAGLHILLLNIVQRFCGRVTIRSMAGLVEFDNRNGMIYATPRTNVGFCVGTTIDLVIRTDQIPFAEEEENFEW